MALVNSTKNNNNRDFPGGPVFEASPTSAGGVGSTLVEELRSHTPRIQKKKT